ncbi:hypothetical protein SAMD00019534_008660, partial [Acytostelium subglobosum LB1]|uniref:hypothetical protein n=1 Tax=Acytostelium subglobosum LB1 TaxID=1410327 RepID=UPI000644ECEE
QSNKQNNHITMQQQQPRKKTSIIQSPIRLLETLSTVSQDQGNTPRPSRSILLFIGGMQALSKGDTSKTTEDKLSKALEEAEKSNENEELASALLGIGYLYSFDSDQPAQVLRAIQSYKRSLDLWKLVHSATSPKLIGLLGDLAALQQHQQQKAEALASLNECLVIYKSQGLDKPTNNDFVGLQDLINKL